MTKNHNLILFTIALSGLLGVLWWLTGSIKPNSGQSMIWFNGGLLALLVARFIIEYHFPKPNDVFLNCLAVFISVSTLSSPPLAEWWEGLRWAALATGLIALVLAWDTRRSGDEQPTILRRAIYAIVTSIGRSTVIFSIVFLLALLSFFELDNFQTKVLAITWGAILLIANLRFDRILVGFRTKTSPETLGFVSSFLAPRTLFFERADGVKLQNGQVIGIKSSSSGSIASAVVVGERRSPRSTWYVANLLSSTLRDTDIDQTSKVVAQTQNFSEDGAKEAEESDLVAGLVSDGSSVSTLQFEVLGEPNIATGSVLGAMHLSGEIYYQLFDGIVCEEPSLEKSDRSYVTARAEQIGIWDTQTNGFKTFGWVARENSPVTLIDEKSNPGVSPLAHEDTKIGHIPNSKFPAVVSLKDLVLFHSAVVGVTGSGKSFLTFELLEKCALTGIKVVCIDPTGDYQRHLSTAVLIRSHNALTAFLDSDDQMIGILETAINKENPILQCHNAAKICLNWCKDHRKEDEIVRPTPKVMFVMEEAHLLIPEWSFNPVKNLQDKVNLTSQIVLQSRKYGLGFLIVAQRTANVSKSALNQCNTIFALQQFDQTGAEFLGNYMGRHHVSSLPNLQDRHGIVVGKASASQRPILVRFNDQDRALNEKPIPDMPTQLEEESVGAADRNAPKVTRTDDLIG